LREKELLSFDELRLAKLEGDGRLTKLEGDGRLSVIKVRS
jgi:hypothetical protein